MYYVWGIKLYFILDLVLGLIICVCTADLLSQTVKLQALGTRCSFLTSFWVRTMDVSRGRWRMHSYGIWKWWRHKYVVYLWNTLLRLALHTLSYIWSKTSNNRKISSFFAVRRAKNRWFFISFCKKCAYFRLQSRKFAKTTSCAKRKRKGGFALAENSTTPWKISWWRPSHEPANNLCVMGSSDKE